MLLYIFFNEDYEWNVLERTKIFLEIFGNLVIKEQTANLIKTCASNLFSMTTEESESLISNLIDVSKLTFREIDDLESVFKFWKNDKLSFDVNLLWEHRLRKHFKQQYDSRENIIDWDYHMKLLSKIKIPPNKDCIVYKGEYLRWRMTGVAFGDVDGASCRGNRVLGSVEVLNINHQKVPKWGYFSDILTGPFLSYGVKSKNKELFKKFNDKYKNTAADVSEYNVRSLIHQYRSHTPLDEAQDSQKIMEIDESSVTSQTAKTISNSLKNFKIMFLPSTTLSTKKLDRKIGSNIKFDAVFLSPTYALEIPYVSQFLKRSCGNSDFAEKFESLSLRKDSAVELEFGKFSDGCLVLETADFILDFTKDQTEALREKLRELCTSSKLQAVELDNVEYSEYMIYTNSKMK
ncbi:Dynein assembly factor 3, axonemal [Nowakowskiella sp. JEL0407]|nr:Dynein assembly factor 3, axonemal [Nowakowskiella sp. JEL0407]